MPESEQEWKEAYEAREHNIAAARQQVSVVVNALGVVRHYVAPQGISNLDRAAGSSRERVAPTARHSSKG